MDKSIGDMETIGPDDRDGHNRGELAQGTHLGRYKIIKLLGRGEMGQVHLVRHDMQETLHALKILPPEFSGRPGFVERFRTELKTMARLQHPNIVHVQYSDEETGYNSRKASHGARVAGQETNWRDLFEDVNDGYEHTSPVASFPPNAFGLYDTIGNVWEWCSDWFQDSYEGLPDTDPTGPGSRRFRALRGGSWLNPPRHCRSAYRRRGAPGYRRSINGFRVVLDFP